MKKFFLLPLLALLFASCSTDNDEQVFNENAVTFSTVEPNANRNTMVTTPVNCVAALSGNVMIDVSGGFTNPKVVFIADVAQGTTRAAINSYTLSLEIQPLSDCENLSSGSGTVSRFSLYNVSIPNTADPSISLLPSQLPSNCYRWRWVLQGGTLTAPCTTVTPWYEEPLF
jgi:hypothetical protein